MVTSPKNPLVQHVRRLQQSGRYRQEQQEFVVEGVRLAEEVLAAGWTPRLALYSPELSARGQRLIEQLSTEGKETKLVTDAVLRAASDTITPQGLLLVVPMRSLAGLPHPNFLLIPDRVRDPGNLGTMLRTAAAAGVQQALIPPGTVDPFAPKVVRSAMGAHFHLPIQQMSWTSLSAELDGLTVFLAEAHAGTLYTQADFQQPLALIIGGEAAGAGEEAQRIASQRVHIPIPGSSESLNAAMAAAILMFEVVRQRTSPEA